MRDLLIDAFNLWFKLPEFELTKIKSIVRMLHNASLLYAYYTILVPAASHKSIGRRKVEKRILPFLLHLKSRLVASLRSILYSNTW